MTDYSELKRLAEAATPGRNFDRYPEVGGGLKYECTGDDGSLVLKVDHKNDEWGFVGEKGEQDEAFFLACTPATVLELIAEIEQAKADGTDAFGLAQARADQIEQLKAENDALRKIIGDCATSCGAAVSEKCSLDFMSFLPQEISSVISALRTDAQRWRFVRTPIGTSSTLAVWREGRVPLFSGIADAAVDAAMNKEASHG
jgi:hypothetical protein